MMAANTVKSRVNAKNRYIKGQSRHPENVVEPDLSTLRKPVLTSISSFGQARKIFDGATEELQSLMSSECDVMFECRVCRSIFRSLVNFFSHKRVYCKEKFNNTVHGHFIRPHSTLTEMMKLKQLEEDYQEFLKNSDGKKDEVPHERVPISKDLTSVIENLNKNKEIAKSPQSKEEDAPQVSLQAIMTSSAAVYQNIVENENSPDEMSTEVNELHAMFANDTAVLNEEGQFKIVSNAVEKPKKSSEADQVIQISDDEEDVDPSKLKCLICELQFATRKTLKYHVRYKHVENRLVYPCPECVDLFASSWTVYRHLFKVHKKSPAQIRRIRDSIQSKAFRLNNPPAYYEKRKNNIKLLAEQKLSEEERMDRENQAWMDNLEGDGEVPRCGGCGRSFERRAALAAHTHTCQSRTRALARKPPDVKKLNVPTRKTKEDDSRLAVGQVRSSIISKSHTKDDEDDEMEQLEVNASDDEKPLDDPGSDQDAKKDDKIQLTFPEEIERENMEMLKKKIKPFIDRPALQCKKCDRKFTSMEPLTKHMAFHLNWTRYACKLCNYKTYEKDTLLGHLKVVHKLKGNAEFYMSTVKALSANEALQFADIDDNSSGEADEAESPDSKKESDSNYSDNESVSSNPRSSAVLKRRRNFNKPFGKRRKVVKSKSTSPLNDEQKPDTQKPGIPIDKVMRVIFGDEHDSSEKDKNYDSGDVYKRKREKLSQLVEASSAIRRPVRKRVRPKKDDDFEYDLSNLLRMDAEANKEIDKDKQHVVQRRDESTPRPATYKRRSQPEAPSSDETTELPKAKFASDPAPEKPRSVPNKVAEASKATFQGALRKLSYAAVQQSCAHLKQLLGSSVSRSVVAVPNILRAQILPKSIVRTPVLKRNVFYRSDNPLMKNVPENTKQSSTLPPQDEETKTRNSDMNSVDMLNAKQASFQIPNLESKLKKPIRITDLTKGGKILVVKQVKRNMDALHPIKIQTIQRTQADKDDSKPVTVRLPSIDCSAEVAKEKPPDVEGNKLFQENLPNVNGAKVIEQISH